jgi:hypothetical protein
LRDTLNVQGKHRLHAAVATHPEIVEWLKRQGLQVIDADAIYSAASKRMQSPLSTDTGREVAIDAWLFLLKNDKLWGNNARMFSEDGFLRDTSALFVPGTRRNWKPLYAAGMLPGHYPLHSGYLDPLRLGRWNLSHDQVVDSLETAGLHGFDRSADESLTEDAAYQFFETRLAGAHRPRRVTDRHLRGHDYECFGHCAMVFEVKGMAEPSDIDFPASEYRVATERRGEYILICVYNLPANPGDVQSKSIPDPSRLAVSKGDATVPKSRWLADP